MNSNYEWIALAISIVAFILTLIERFNSIQIEKLNDSFFAKFKKHIIKNIPYRQKYNIPFKTIKLSLISSYNFRNMLSSLPFFSKLPISSRNYFIRAYIYDHEKRISSNNYLIKATIPITITKRGER